MNATIFTPHETRYKDYLFRSRLEARYAAFFDLLGWPYAYEPVELAGYIPDFILRFYQPLLVEVKPCWTLEELNAHAPKINHSGWQGEALLVGLGPIDDDTIGLLRDTGSHPADPSHEWATCRVFYCLHCERYSLYHQTNSWHCRVSGCYSGADYLGDPGDIGALWAQAHEITRWLPGR